MFLSINEIPNSLNVSLSYILQETGTDIENASEKYSPDQQKIITAIKSNSRITYAALSKPVGIAPTKEPGTLKS